MKHPINIFILRAAIVVVGIAFLQSAWAADYEQEPVFKASQILSEKMRAGQNFTVNEKVVNRGFMNHYTVKTTWGSFTAKSNAQLALGLYEVAVIAAIKEMLANDEVSKAVKEQGTDSFDNAKKLLQDPGKVIVGAVEGAKKLFSLGSRALKNKSASSVQEDSKWKSLVGFSSKKREYAAQFKIDPYTTNALMVDALDELTWTTHSSKLTSGFLISLIPVVGIAATVSNTSDVLNEVLVLKSPLELRESNIKTLTQLGINNTVINLLMKNKFFTPTSQTLFVQALASMKSTKGLEEVIGVASLSEDVETAILRQRQMQMYAAYHQKINPIKDFVSIGNMAYAITSKEKALVVSPLDYLTWTKEVDDVASAIKAKTSKGNGVLELWLAGTASETTALMFEKKGWVLHINAEQSLLGNIRKG